MNEDQTRSNGFQESAGNDAGQSSAADQSPVQFDKEELDWLVRSLRLTTEQCVILLETLKERNRLKAGIDVHVYDDLEQEIQPFFGLLTNGTWYIKDIPGLFNWLMRYDYDDPSEWVLEIKYDQSKKSLKCTMTIRRYLPFTFLESNPKFEVTEPFEMLREVLENVGYKALGGWELRGDFSAKLARHFESFKMNGDQPNACAPTCPDMLDKDLAAAAVDVEMNEDSSQENAENSDGQSSAGDQSSVEFDKEELDEWARGVKLAGDLLDNGLLAAAVDIGMNEDSSQESAENSDGQSSEGDQSSGEFDKEEFDEWARSLKLARDLLDNSLVAVDVEMNEDSFQESAENGTGQSSAADPSPDESHRKLDMLVRSLDMTKKVLGSMMAAYWAKQSPGQFDKEELDTLVRRLKLTRKQCVILLKRLKNTNKLKAGIDVHVYDNCVQEILHFFGRLTNGTQYIKDVPGLFEWMDYDYVDPSEWALEIKYDQSKKNLRCTLIDTLEVYDPLTFLESDPKFEVTEPFEMLREVLENVGYKALGGWELRGDFSAKLARHFQSSSSAERRPQA